MKIVEMTSNRFRRCGEKENRALNGHIRNCFPSKNGNFNLRLLFRLIVY